MVATSSAKVSGSAGALINYLKDGMGAVSGKVSAYYETRPFGLLFDRVEGGCARFMGYSPGVGMTRKQFEDLFEGKLPEGEQFAKLLRSAPADRQVLKGGWAKLYETNAAGRQIKVQDAENPKKWVPVPIMEPVMVPKKNGRRIVRDDKGDPVLIPKLDADGKPVMRQAQEYRFNSGYDVTFGANKSVTQNIVAHPELADLHRELFMASTDTAMRLGVEKTARMVRPRDAEGKQVRVKASGLMWAPTFGHVARPTKLSEERGFIGGDPQLHVHNFLFAWGLKDGQFTKIDGDDLMKTAEFRQSIADVDHTYRLMQAGFQIDFKPADRKGRVDWELRGHNKQVMDFISSNTQRRKDIIKEFELKHKHPPSKEDVDQIMKATKGKKTAAVKKADLGEQEYFEHCESVLQRHGMTAEMPGPVDEPVELPTQRSARKAQLIAAMDGPTGVVRDGHSAFSSDLIYPAAMRAAVGLGFSVDEVMEIADEFERTHLIELDPTSVKVASALGHEISGQSIREGEKFYTTRSLLDAERGNKMWLDAKAVDPGLRVNDFYVRLALSRHLRLNKEQRMGVAAISSGSQLVYITGPAGAGKTTMLKAAVEARRADKRHIGKVITCAVQAKRGIATGKGIDADDYGSIDRIAYLVEAGKLTLTASDMVIVDEASLVDSLSLAKLRNAVGTAKVVFVGDPRQNEAIGPSGWFKDELGNRPFVELVEVHRQVDEKHVELLNEIRSGHSTHAIVELDKLGMIDVEAKPELMVKRALETYVGYRRQLNDKGKPLYTAKEVSIVFNGSNPELDAYNRAVQRYRMAAYEVNPLQAVEVIDESTGRWWELRRGDHILFNDAYWTPGMKEGIRNGSVGEITRTYEDGQVRVRLDDDKREVTIMAGPWINLRYAVHNAKMQGDEVRACINVAGKPSISDLRSGYAQLSRFIESMRIILNAEHWGDDPIKEFGEALSVAHDKELAMYYADIDAGDGVTLEQRDLEIDTDFDRDDPSLTRPRIEDFRYHGVDRGLEMTL